MDEKRDRYPQALSPDFSGALRTFAYWMASGSVGHPLLAEIDYRPVMLEEPSLMEIAFAIFANVLRFDEKGGLLNAKYAEHRAAQYIRQYCDEDYVVSPPFEDFELELHDAPDLEDPLPWPVIKE